LSSIAMQFAYWSAKKDEILRTRLGLGITLLLGTIFLVLQVKGWGQLVEIDIFLGGSSSNPAGSFVYIISGAHALHIVAGLIFLMITLFKSLRYQVHSQNLLTISMCNTFWHFLGGLWLFLFFVLLQWR
jgi:cytochrome c oxidase subunit III